MTPTEFYEKYKLFDLEKRLGYSFRDSLLLSEALSHQSFIQTDTEVNWQNNERMEFLGDAILEWSITLALFKKFPEKREGELTKIRAGLVSRKTMTLIAKRIKLEQYLLIDNVKGILPSGMDMILSNATEALIAAIYLDLEKSGEVSKIHELIIRIYDDFWEDKTLECLKNDSKSLLNEWLHRRKIKNSEYDIQEIFGKNSVKKYKADFKIGEKIYGTGIAPNKKQAETQAASETLAIFKQEKDGTNQ